MMDKPVIAITPGEPAGIGPDVLLQLCAGNKFKGRATLLAVASPSLLADRAKKLGLDIAITPVDIELKRLSSASNQSTDSRHSTTPLPELFVLPVNGYSACQPGVPVDTNAPYILETLSTATALCLAEKVSALVTGPVNKHLINSGLKKTRLPLTGVPDNYFFSGHTEFLASLTHTDTVVMMLAGKCTIAKNDILRVALLTTHVPLTQVSTQVTTERLEKILHILNRELKNRFSIDKPRILVCGLNPHAGEQGDLGDEELQVINPVIAKLRTEGFDLSEALPADTLFTAHHLAGADAVLSMYHDQGLPVLKSHCFGNAANITLGLPIVRTSVDHGTAFDLAGTGRASAGSLETAINCALEMSASASCKA